MKNCQTVLSNGCIAKKSMKDSLQLQRTSTSALNGVNFNLTYWRIENDYT